MPFSINSIREINQFHLLAINIPTDGSDWADPTAGEKQTVGGKKPWKVSLYATNGLTVGGSIQTTEPLGSYFNKIFDNKAINFATQWLAPGLVPQFDFAQKLRYSGNSPLTFTVVGSLVLQNSIEDDFLIPLKKLAYLTFPKRSFKLSISDTIDWIQKKCASYFGDDSFLANVTNNVGSLVGTIVGSSKSGQEIWQSMVDSFNRVVGQVYFMESPPTFRMTKTGSGLDLRYGKVLISDVYIRSLQVNLPTLYYEGGFPAVIPITMEMGTFRPITADSFYKMLSGKVQSWTTDAETKTFQEYLKESGATISGLFSNIK